MKFGLPRKAEMIIIGVSLVCLALFLFAYVRINSPHPCRAGCGNMVKDKFKDRKDCENCGLSVWGCIATYPSATFGDPLEYHRVPNCEGCNKPYFLCFNPNLSLEQQSFYRHRIISRGTPHERYACKPEVPALIPIPDK